MTCLQWTYQFGVKIGDQGREHVVTQVTTLTNPCCRSKHIGSRAWLQECWETAVQVSDDRNDVGEGVHHRDVTAIVHWEGVI